MGRKLVVITTAGASTQRGCRHRSCRDFAGRSPVAAGRGAPRYAAVSRAGRGSGHAVPPREATAAARGPLKLLAPIHHRSAT